MDKDIPQAVVEARYARCYSFRMSRIRQPALIATLAVVLGCQGPPAAPTATVDQGAMPRHQDNPRQAFDDLKDQRYQAAIAGLEFGADGVVVADPMPRRDRDDAFAYIAQGDEKLAANKRTGALAAYTLAVRSDPELAVAWLGLGQALVTKGKIAEALAAARMAARLDPELVAAQYDVAMTLARLGQLDEAITEMQRVVEIDDRHSGAHERMAIWYYYLDDTPASWRHVQAARDLGREPPDQFIVNLQAKTPGRPPAAP